MNKNEENTETSSETTRHSDKQREFSTGPLGCWSEMCRVCANPNENIIPIFDGEGAEHELSKKISKYLPIKVTFPYHINK